MRGVTDKLPERVQVAFAQRNELFEQFFGEESPRLAAICREMSERFLNGGRLLAFGKGPYTTDAQHVSVEFVHPVIVGKRALPALDISSIFRASLRAILQPEDIVMGFGPPNGDTDVQGALDEAEATGALTLALPGDRGSYPLRKASENEFVHQEMVEVLYHTLWETVHVFFEHRELGLDVGETNFLYPFLGSEKQETGNILTQVAQSIREKVAEDAKLRSEVSERDADNIANAARSIGDRVRCGGKLILCGNGGSATDANDWAIDCVAPPHGLRPVPAVSLSSEPANITALANDIGTEVIFSRQLMAHARTPDVVVAISTSGGSKNIVLALEEARRRGLLVVALLGYDGGEVVRRRLADHALVVRSDHIPRIQEVQASIYHTLRELMEATAHGV